MPINVLLVQTYNIKNLNLDKLNGGLNMINMIDFQISFVIKWFSKLIDQQFIDKWKSIPKYELLNYE